MAGRVGTGFRPATAHFALRRAGLQQDGKALQQWHQQGKRENRSPQGLQRIGVSTDQGFSILAVERRPLRQRRGSD